MAAQRRIFGASGIRWPGISLRHVLPNFAPLIGVQASVTFALAILAEAAPLVQTRMNLLGAKVVAVDKTGLELVSKISPEGDKTPTLGRERSFFEDIFGNIGTVGAPGTGAPAGP